MRVYLFKRAIRALLVLVGASVLSFGLCEMAPGDFFSEARLNPQVSEETLTALRTRYALDRPLISRYGSWIASVARGEWGYSMAYGAPAGPIVLRRALNTLLLTISAAVLAWLFAIPAAIWTAATGTSFGRGLYILVGIPDVLIVLVLSIVAVQSGLLPPGGMTSPGHSEFAAATKIGDILLHMVLPVSALVVSAVPMLYAHAHRAICSALASSFVRTARAVGIPRHRLLFRHALPIAAGALAPLVGLSVGTLLSSSLVVEAVTGWPGVGRLLLESTLQRDQYLVVAAVLFSAIFLVAGNLVGDLILYSADPRIRKS
jgi:peptide/nickel transport system permease protein